MSNLKQILKRLGVDTTPQLAKDTKPGDLHKFHCTTCGKETNHRWTGGRWVCTVCK